MWTSVTGYLSFASSNVQTACYVEYILAVQNLAVQLWSMEDNYIIECGLSQQAEKVK